MVKSETELRVPQLRFVNPLGRFRVIATHRVTVDPVRDKDYRDPLSPRIPLGIAEDPQNAHELCLDGGLFHQLSQRRLLDGLPIVYMTAR